LVAKNRDRVGNYLAGVSYPSADNLREIAKALGLKVDALAVKAPMADAPELRGALDVTFTVLDRQPGLAVMQMRKLMSVETGIAILKLLKEDKLPASADADAEPADAE
jgi:transcriptional regulator with XRE-family HTH domain